MAAFRPTELKGIMIKIHGRDHNPPHVHVLSADLSAALAIDDGRVLRGELPGKLHRRVRR